MQTISPPKIYQAKNKIRIITAAALFDGHDVAINIMRRILQDSGAEIIHLGHNRSVMDIVRAAVQEDAQGIAISSYQGGHVAYFKYMKDLLDKFGGSHIKLFGGGGGVIVPEEIADLHAYGISKIFSPDDGRELGLQGMINYILETCDFSTEKYHHEKLDFSKGNNWGVLAGLISNIENSVDDSSKLNKVRKIIHSKLTRSVPTLGITGTGGAGKSSLTDELIRRFLLDFSDMTIAVLSVDPTKRKTGGALLADRIRMNSLTHSDRVYMRSLATRRANLATSAAIKDAVDACRIANYDLIIVETSGIGQSDSEIIDISDLSVYVMTSEYGAATQLEKIDMIDYADIIAINKFERKGSLDAYRDVKKQYRRSRKLFDPETHPDESLPVFGTMASQFNDPGINSLYFEIINRLSENFEGFTSQLQSNNSLPVGNSNRSFIVPPERVRYLAEIADDVKDYKQWVQEQCDYARKLWQLKSSNQLLHETTEPEDPKKSNQSPRNPAFPREMRDLLNKQIEWHSKQISPENLDLIKKWPDLIESYKSDKFVYQVRGKDIVVDTSTNSLSNLPIPKVALPNYVDWGQILEWQLMENVPGKFPFTAGVFPFKRVAEDPTRMFAGEGPPERTNKRCHYLAKEQQFTRLSTAFDSVTLYGEDPHERPDIYGKVGESGVSICTVEDMERLYAGFDLTAPTTSVSMTINGPAPIILAMFMNTAVRQQTRKWGVENNKFSPAEAYVRTGDNRYGFNVHSGEYWHSDAETPDLKSWEEIREQIPDQIYNELRNS
ncbi:MAG: methylmalonyl-CoA mutase family protein, partial [Candidatus Heimdallarchaeota archaeon]|nr:methylmalonyl-CoA mutase family protein [Candidatus Heimdallarchaeota archaeon]